MAEAGIVGAGAVVAEVDLLEVFAKSADYGEGSLRKFGCGEIDDGYAEMGLVEGVDYVVEGIVEFEEMAIVVFHFCLGMQRRFGGMAEEIESGIARLRNVVEAVIDDGMNMMGRNWNGIGLMAHRRAERMAHLAEFENGFFGGALESDVSGRADDGTRPLMAVTESDSEHDGNI